MQMTDLTLSGRLTKKDSCANSVDPGETARLIKIYTVCHSVFDIRLKPLFASVNMSRFKDGRVHFRNLGMQGLIFSFFMFSLLSDGPVFPEFISYQLICLETSKTITRK